MIKKWVLSLCISVIYTFIYSQSTNSYLLKPERVFDGEEMHTGWWVWVDSGMIKGVGPSGTILFPKRTSVMEFPGKTLMPGMIEGHGHLFLTSL